MLRHKPETLGLSLERGGWVGVDDLIAAAGAARKTLTRELLGEVVERDERKRYSFSDDGQKIRANYGHSVPVDLGLESVAPPELLFHGTAARYLNSVKRDGIEPGNRTHVHLSPDRDSAIAVGKRHGDPVVLTVRARRMHESGFKFFHSDSGIWLTGSVPAEHIEFPDLSRSS